MEKQGFQPSITFLKQLTAYLGEVAEESDRTDSSPETIRSDLTDLVQSAGAFEGRRLKGWGLLTEEFQDVLRNYAECFGIEVEFPEPFTLPYPGKMLTLKSDTPHAVDEFWLVFLSSVLSVYAMQAVCLEQKAEGAYQVVEAASEQETGSLSPADEARIREYVHKVNNHLGGIVSFASLISGTAKDKERAEMILKSARALTELTKKAFQKKESN